MNVEQLQAMSDSELNELSAVKVMGYHMYHYDKDYEENCYYLLLDGIDAVNPLSQGYKTEKEAWRDWNPTTDMNDAYSLLQSLIPAWTVSIGFNLSGWEVGLWTGVRDGDKYVSGTDQSLPRAITIASILAKEEEQ